MLILILINVQYLQNVVFSSGEGANGQNHSSPASQHPTNNPSAKFPIPTGGIPPPLNTI